MVEPEFVPDPLLVAVRRLGEVLDRFDDKVARSLAVRPFRPARDAPSRSRRREHENRPTAVISDPALWANVMYVSEGGRLVGGAASVGRRASLSAMFRHGRLSLPTDFLRHTEDDDD